jgi:hypothetical protein
MFSDDINPRSRDTVDPFPRRHTGGSLPTDALQLKYWTLTSAPILARYQPGVDRYSYDAAM